MKLDPNVDDLDSLIDHFKSSMKSMLDLHAPEQYRRGKSKPIQPWYDAKTHISKRKRRAVERKWITKSTQSVHDSISQNENLEKNRLIIAKRLLLTKTR